MPLPSSDEAARLELLAQYGVLDTGPDEALDELVALASAICNAPIALLSLVDATRQWFKARFGLAAQETLREYAFCAHAIAANDELFTVEDARTDARFQNNPLVTGSPRIVFYAGAPLVAEGGAKLGTLCVIDHEPRTLTPLQRQTLSALSKLVVKHLQQRRDLAEHAAEQERLQALLVSIGDAVISADTCGQITFMNPVAETLTGWRRADALGKSTSTILRLIHETTGTPLDSPVDEVLREGVAVERANQTLLVRRDGSEVAIDDSAAPVRNARGALTGVIVIFRDRTLGRKRERELRIFRGFVEASEVFIGVTGAHGRFDYINPAGQRLIGVTSLEAAQALTVEDVLRAPAEADAQDAAPPASGPVSLRTDLLYRNVQTGEVIPITQHRFPIRGKNGELVASGIIARDTRESMRADAERGRLANEVGIARARLSALIEQAPAFVCTLRGPQHVYELVNREYQRLIGADREVVGLPLATALPEIVDQGFIAILDEAYRTGQPYLGNETRIRLDRVGSGMLEDAFLNFVYQPTRDADGNVDGIDVFGFDVTGQVLARREVEKLAEIVRHREGELRAVTDSIPLLVSFVTPDARYGLVNKAYEHWFGQSQEQLAGRRVREVIGEAAWAVLGPKVARGIAGEGFEFEQHGVPYRLGGTRDVKVAFVPRRNDDNQPHGYVAVLEDITKRRQLEQEREVAHARITGMLQFEQQMLGIVSHDLRNPLNVILLSTTLLDQSDLDVDTKKFLKRIRNAAERATSMVKDLLDFTQARLGGGLQMHPRPVAFQDVLRPVMEEIEAAFPGRKLEIREEPGLHGSWDPERLGQVVQNLVTNALKYSFSDSPVRVITGSEAGQLVISVQNMGEPIPEHQLATLFEPFERAGKVDSASRSVGLGLHIVKQIVDAHRGAVSVHSSAAEGTTFKVCLPMQID